MSKINAVRIINLNYNNNSMRVSDEVFQLGGQSTLMSLRNGGGKSVVVQMITAPFVHKQYRKTKDRPFESYFTSSKPTFIMVEWKLDQGAGYCLTGMMVRKSQLQDEQSTEPLEIVNFVSEYTTRCEQDIYNIPVIEKNKKEIILKGFNECKQIFEAYKKERSKKFTYYDMNNHAQQKQYFDRLAEYKIYYKEWENIIRKVNLKESGLSELFADCKNEKELLEKWFVKTIESKLNGEQDRIKEFQNIIEKYVRMYKDNKSKIDRKDTILQFKNDMSDMEGVARDYLLAEEEVCQDENLIACLARDLEVIKVGLQEEIADIKEKIIECEVSKNRALYEKISKEYYDIIEEKMSICKEVVLLEMELNQLNNKIMDTDNILHKYECAKQQETVDECVKDYENARQKLLVLLDNKKDFEEERQGLGAYLRKHYKGMIDEVTEAERENNEKIQKENDLCKQYKQRVEECDENIKNLAKKIGGVNERIKAFDDTEDDYNKRYNEKFIRNIVGEYESGFIDIKKSEYEKELSEYSRSCNAHIREKSEKEEEKRSKERDKEDKNTLKYQIENELHMIENDMKEYEKQIQERRAFIRYIEATEDMLWDRVRLLEMFDRKLTDIDNSRNQLKQEEHTLQKEWKKLTSGEILELPAEFSELMSKLGLHPVYGMSWLEKNGNSVEKNTRLIRQHPFLPYALILSDNEINKLEKHGKDIYTSYPIPLISRESLDKTMMEEEGVVVRLDNISFYMWFNEKLLDPDALQAMVSQMEAEINKKKDQIKVRNEEYDSYYAKRSSLANQVITKELVDETYERINEAKNSIRNIENEICCLTDEIKSIGDYIIEISDMIIKEKECIRICQMREQDFGAFAKAYDVYKKCRKELEGYLSDEKKNEDNKKNSQSMYDIHIGEVDMLEKNAQKLGRALEEYSEQLSKYLAFNEDVEYDNSMTIEAAQARYDVITTKVSGDIRDAEELSSNFKKKMEKAESELIKLQEKYSLKDDEWKELIYNEDEYYDYEMAVDEYNKKADALKSLMNNKNTKIAVKESEAAIKKKQLNKECDEQEPLPIEEIFIIDFDAEIGKIDYRIKELKAEENNVNRHIESVNQNMNVLSEYQDLEIVEAVEWEIPLADMSETKLREFIGTIRRDYRNSKETLLEKREKVQSRLNGLLRRDIYAEDYYSKPLEAMLSVKENAKLVLEQMAMTIQSYDSQLEKLAVDIAMVEKEKEKIAGLLEDYVKEVHNNMSMIDNNSTITIRERPIKMLRIQIPEWEENEGLYRQRMDDYMDELTNGGIRLYENNENATDYFSSRITTKNLYDSVIGLGNIQIKLYKIEEQREYPITWADVSRNSGGEGFLSAFVILSSLLHYMRRDETDIFADKNEGKVLVMDNPFAQTNSAHLLKPLMDMAKKTNTQLICLSGLGGDSIYSRFDNIYVLNLVNTSLRGGVQYLRGEHKKGVEEEVMVSSQIEVMEQQMWVF